jgi:oxalate---CoA ligase
MTISTRAAVRRSSARGPLGTGLRELLWLRSLTGPHHTFVASVGGDRSVTYGELRRTADRWSALLDDLRVPDGATVGLAVSDPVDFSLVFLGVIAAGRVAGPLDPGATDAEVSSACRRIAPVVVVSDRPARPDVDAEWVALPPGAFGLSDPEHEVEHGHGGGLRYGTSLPIEPVGPGPDLRAGTSGGVVLSTSGTSGAPKLIHLSEHQLLHTASAVAAHHQLSVTDRGFNPLPLFHINAEVVGLLSTLMAGATVVLDDRFHRHGFWDAMGRQRITWINAVPAVLARVSALEDGETVPPGIRFARSASAPLPVPVLERFERRTGIAVVETYGMTEAASQITANPVGGVRKPGSVGRPVGAEVRVVADRVGAEARVAANGVGALAVGRVEVRGPSVITSYAGPGYEDRFDAGGWLDTGDLGYFDGDGYLYLVGRADDVINRSGEKIHPREVEDVILADPAVLASVVVGDDDEVLGQVPVAYLVAEGVRGTGDRRVAAEIVCRVQERCASRLSRPKCPVAFHVVDRLPAGATGKVRRRAVGGGPPIYSLRVR